MNSFQPRNSEFEREVRDSFDKQPVMRLIGAGLKRVEPGFVDIGLAFRDDLTQQNGFIHAGIISTLADSACGYAAYTLMPAGSGVLSVEFKVNLLCPAAGERFVAEARVIKAGASLTVVSCDVYAWMVDESRMIATMLATMITR